LFHKPRYWETPEGQVIKAIVFEDKHTFHDLVLTTRLEENKLSRILATLYHDGVLVKYSSQYFVTSELLDEYLEHEEKEREI
jgi:hypothetical protein